MSYHAGIPLTSLAQQEIVRTEEQRDIELEDVVFLSLKWLHVPAHRPAPQLLLCAATTPAANQWICCQMLLVLQLLQQRRGSHILLHKEREGWGRSHFCLSQDVVVQVLSSVAKPFRELSTSGHCHSAVSLCHSLLPSWGASVTVAWVIEMIQVKNSSFKGLESLFDMLLFDWNRFTTNSTSSLAQLTGLQIAMSCKKLNSSSTGFATDQNCWSPMQQVPPSHTRLRGPVGITQQHRSRNSNVVPVQTASSPLAVSEMQFLTESCGGRGFREILTLQLGLHLKLLQV